MQPAWRLALGLEATLRLSYLAIYRMNVQKRLFPKVLGRRSPLREKLISQRLPISWGESQGVVALPALGVTWVWLGFFPWWWFR